jgi:hypothetical protein
VRFVQYDDAVPRQSVVGQRLAQQHAVRDELDARGGPAAVVEADGVAHLLAHRAAPLGSHALGDGHCGHSPRLCAHDAARPPRAPSPAALILVQSVAQELRQLCALPAARLAHHHGDGLGENDL